VCSIGGFISSEPLPADTCYRLAAGLLFYGQDRGAQSSGIFINNKLLKQAQPAEKFVFGKAFSEMFEEPASLCLLHNRQPTCGGEGDEQAHPFWVGATISVHNGWLTNCKELKQKWGIEKPSGVDSELLAAAMDKLGPQEFSKFMRDVHGNAAVAMLHRDELFVGRDGNPFEYLSVDIEFNGEPITITVFGSTETQVKMALNHCWLVTGSKRTATLPTQKLFKMSASGVIKDVGVFSTKSYGTRYSYGGPANQEEMADWDGYGESFHHRVGTGDTAYKPRGNNSSIWRPMIKTTKEDGTVHVEIGGEKFSLSELVAIKSDPTILAATHHMPIGQRLDTVHGFSRYSWRYEIMQRVKFGDLKDVIPTTMKALDFKTEKTPKGKKRAKKERNRNGSIKSD
jgi:hypothetical protein